MSNIPGVSVEITNSIVSVQGPPANAIAVIGHVGATLPGSVTKFTASQDGDILTFSSLTDALDQLGGQCDGTGWTAGVKDSGAGATPPHDTKDNLLRALDLIYAANSSAKVYAAVLDGAGDPLVGTSSLPDGAQGALDLLLEFQDVGYVVLANIDPIAAGKSHAEAAANKDNPYNSPRLYCTGIDLYTVWDATNNGGAAPPLNTADLAFMSSIQSAEGLVTNYVGNHEYDFSRVVNSTVTADVVVEIGGQLVAAWAAGRLSANGANFAMTNEPALSKPRWDGSDYIFKTASEVDDATGEGFLIVRFKNNTYVINKGVTYTSDSKWTLLPHREITSALHKTAALNLDTFIKEPKTTGLFLAAQQTLDGILADNEAANLIRNSSGTVKDHPTIADALFAELSFETIKPTNQIIVSMTVG